MIIHYENWGFYRHKKNDYSDYNLLIVSLDSD